MMNQVTKGVLRAVSGWARSVLGLGPCVEERALELERRELLAGDLAVTVGDPTLAFSRFNQGFVIRSEIVVTNVGDAAIRANFRLLVSVSTDRTVGDDYTVFTRSYITTVKVGGTLKPRFSVPVPRDLLGVNGQPSLEPGSYHLRALILYSTGGDESAENNNGFSEGTFPLSYTFGGTGEGRSRSTLQTVLRNGQAMKFEIDGPGRGELVVENGQTLVRLFATTSRSSIWMTPGVRGVEASISGIEVEGSLGEIRAPGVTVNGNITISGSLRSVRVAGLSGSAVSIGGSASPLSGRLGTVENVSLDTAGNIFDLRADSWTSSDGGNDAVVAPSVSKLVIAGDFGVDLLVSGRAAVVQIGGVASGRWDVTGAAEKITIGSGAASLRINSSTQINSLTVRGELRGLVTAPIIESVYVGGNLENVNILAGTDLGSDSSIGGTGAAADIYSFGYLGLLRVKGGVNNSFIAAGVNPTDSVFLNGNDVFAASGARLGKIIILGVTRNTTFVAPKLPQAAIITGLTVETATDGRFRSVLT